MGAYRLVRKLATGGMAEVFLGKVVGLDGFEKPVAVKRILPHLSEDPIFVGLFLQEAKLTVSLQHANVVQVFDLGALRGQYYMVLEFIDGENLRALLSAAAQRQVSVGLREACYVTQQVAEGLAYAHERKDPSGKPLNIVHRDINPTNVMINRTGEVKLADFGIAKATGSASNTQAGTIKAKTGYMAPEQAAGDEPDQRSDVFLLGLLLYELLSGRRLFQETELIKSIKEIAFFDPKKIPSIDGVPPALRDILLRALSPHAQVRTPTARELSNQLTGFLFDNRLRVGNQDTAALFSRAVPGFRSALESLGGEAGEEIRLSASSATPAGASSPANLTPATARAVGMRGAAARSPTDELPVVTGAPVPADDGSIKIDRKSQAVVLSLMGEGKLTHDRLPMIAELQQRQGIDFLAAMVKSGVVTEEDVLVALAETLRVPFVSTAKLDAMAVPKDAVRLLSLSQSRRLRAVPIAIRSGQLFCAMADVTDATALEGLKALSGRDAVAILATSEGIERARQRFYGAADVANSLDGGWGKAPVPAPPAGADEDFSLAGGGWGGSAAPSFGGSSDLELSPEGNLVRPGAAAPTPAPAPVKAFAPSPVPVFPSAAPSRRTPVPPEPARPTTPVPPPPVAAPTAGAEPTLRAQERVLAGLFALSGQPLASAPAFASLAQRLAEKLGASEAERYRVGAAASALAVAGRLEGKEGFGAPSVAAVRALLGPAFDALADLLEPATQAQPLGIEAPGPLGLTTAQRFTASARTPAPTMEGAKAALNALRSEALLPRSALDALAVELSDRYVKKPRVLVALRDAHAVADLGRLLASQGFAAINVRSRSEVDLQLREGAVALLADATYADLGTPEGVAALRRDPRLSQLPIVLVAESADPAEAMAGIEAGADDVFALPLNEGMVVAKLRRFSQRRGSP